MNSNFYIVRNDQSDSWQLCGSAGMPCMARSTLAATMTTAARLAEVRANKLTWPIPVFHAVSEDAPAAWDGSIDRDGNWIDRTMPVIGSTVWTVGPHGEPNVHTNRVGLGRVASFHAETNNGQPQAFAYVEFHDGKAGSWPVAQLRTAK